MNTTNATNENGIATDDRPIDCNCWSTGQGLACWPCWRDGFESVNPETPGAEEDD